MSRDDFLRVVFLSTIRNKGRGRTFDDFVCTGVREIYLFFCFVIFESTIERFWASFSLSLECKVEEKVFAVFVFFFLQKKKKRKNNASRPFCAMRDAERSRRRWWWC